MSKTSKFSKVRKIVLLVAAVIAGVVTWNIISGGSAGATECDDAAPVAVPVRAQPTFTG